jgi:diacylglycerol O-acyltransferase
MTWTLPPRRLSALDNAFLAIESASAPMHVGCLAIYDIEASLGDRPTHIVTEILTQVAQEVPALRRRLWPSLPRLNQSTWGPPRRVDVAEHIRSVRLAGAGDRDELFATAGQLFAERLPRNRPLWEVVVIRGLARPSGRGARERFAVLLKMHHAAIDGATGMTVFASMHHRERRDVTGGVSRPAPALPSLVRRLEDMTVDGLGAAFAPWRASLRLGRSLVSGQPAGHDRPPLTLPRTLFEGRVTSERVVVAVSVPRAAIAPIRAAVTGATVNDVMLATVGGALRMLLDRGADAHGVDLIAGVPIARGRHDAAESGNHFDLLRIPLCVGEAVPLRRLLAILHASSAAKQVHRRGSAELNDVAALVPGWLLAAALGVSPVIARWGVPMPAVTTMVSNVAGPRFPLYLGPAELIDLHALGPIANGLGVFHAITSYRKDVTITVTSSPSVLADAAGYATLLRSSFAQLSAAADLDAGVGAR